MEYLLPQVSTDYTVIVTNMFYLFIIHPYCYICNTGLVQLYTTKIIQYIYNISNCNNHKLAIHIEQQNNNFDAQSNPTHAVKHTNITVIKLFKITNKFLSISISFQPAIYVTVYVQHNTVLHTTRCL